MVRCGPVELVRFFGCPGSSQDSSLGGSLIFPSCQSLDVPFCLLLERGGGQSPVQYCTSVGGDEGQSYITRGLQPPELFPAPSSPQELTRMGAPLVHLGNCLSSSGLGGWRLPVGERARGQQADWTGQGGPKLCLHSPSRWRKHYIVISRDDSQKTPCHLDRRAKMGAHTNPNRMFTSGYKSLLTSPF